MQNSLPPACQLTVKILKIRYKSFVVIVFLCLLTYFSYNTAITQNNNYPLQILSHRICTTLILKPIQSGKGKDRTVPKKDEMTRLRCVLTIWVN